MKEKLTQFLNSVAKLSSTREPALATAAVGTLTHVSSIENIDLAAVSASSSGSVIPEPATATGLTNYPPIEKWDDWVEYDSKAWPKKVARRYTLVPTVCFNCESACGLLAYIDKETLLGRSANCISNRNEETVGSSYSGSA